MKIPGILFFLICLLAGVSGCKEPVKPISVNTNSNNRFDSTARYLAGMYTGGSQLHYYQVYADSMDLAFEKMQVSRLDHMSVWAEKELPKTCLPVLYPFSGPDILDCIQFFPSSNHYILMALEDYGSIPQINTLDSTQRKSILHTIYKSLGDVFSKGYFVTRSMVTDVSNHYNGVIPLICISLVRTDHSILDIKYKHLEQDGSTFTDVGQDSAGTRINDCAEIYFRKKGKDKIQKITYFKTNLADEPYDAPDYFKLNKTADPNKIPGLKANNSLRKYLSHLPVCQGYLKSASYLMFQSHFSLIRQIILDRCQFLLQDDTGIPFHYFIRDEWTARLWGQYEKPISIFHGGYFQADLDSIYRSDSLRIGPLYFSLGYHYEDSVQNLMTFKKK